MNDIYGTIDHARSAPNILSAREQFRAVQAENRELRRQLDAALTTIETIHKLWSVDRVIATHARADRYRRTRSQGLRDGLDQQPLVEVVTDDERELIHGVDGIDVTRDAGFLTEGQPVNPGRVGNQATQNLTAVDPTINRLTLGGDPTEHERLATTQNVSELDVSPVTNPEHRVATDELAPEGGTLRHRVDHDSSPASGSADASPRSGTRHFYDEDASQDRVEIEQLLNGAFRDYGICATSPRRFANYAMTILRESGYDIVDSRIKRTQGGAS